MKFIATALLACIAAATHLTYVPVPNATDLVAIGADATALLPGSMTKFKDSYDAKIAAGETPNATEDATQAKWVPLNVAETSKWVAANSKVTTAEADVSIKAWATAQLTDVQKTDVAAYDAAITASTVPTAAQTAANVARTTYGATALQMWGKGEDISVSSAFAFAATGALIAAAALF